MGDTVPELGRRPSLVASLKSKSRSLLARRSTEHESFESTGEHDYAKKYCAEAQQYSRKILHRSTTMFRNIFSIRLFFELDSSEDYYDRLLFRTIMNTNTSLTIKQLCVQEKCI